jgi:ABC-type glutathione transport system ATPase component
MSERSRVLFIGGRSGVGKSAVAAEMFTQLARADVSHCLIEGDTLDLAHPTPWEHGQFLAEMNLAAMWRNYASFGHSRLLYTNTAAVLQPVMESLVHSMGDEPEVTAVLLTARDATAVERLRRREVGSGLDAHVARSRAAARRLQEAAPSWVRRVGTDDRTVPDIAAEIIALSGWQPPEA